MLVRTLFRITICIPLLWLDGCGSRKNTEQDELVLNRLSKAGSPYLREHADNPVDWYEWGAEALEKAKKENKPLIISIGYASCHWCHVMERESFMDTAVARIMNDSFVSIKIDREERPDIDQIYLEAAQLISGNGGWPLNAFALPDGKPFYAATYFPKEQWINLLAQVKQVYSKDKEKLEEQANALTKGIKASDLISSPSGKDLSYDKKAYENIFTSWQSHFDYKWGGISGAPKFPMPVVGEFLLQYHHLTKNKKALEAATRTLDAMAHGGIFDQLAGGFSRYSTDALWQVPHFEKMLYDNGQLVSLYAHGYQVTGNPLYAEVIVKTLKFIKQEMTSPEGGFYSSLNADSEGEEGKFYVWTQAEIEKALDPTGEAAIIPYYQINDSGNWEDKKNVLFRKLTRGDAVSRGKSQEPRDKIIEDAEQTLLKIRNERPRPTLDDKILLSWNALMLKGYLDAYFALGNSEYLATALTNAKFIEKNLIRPDSGLWRNYNHGKANIEAFLDDYALLARSFVFLYQATYDIHWLERARAITEFAVSNFYDNTTGLFFYTSNAAENLVARKMELPDNVIPSSNSVLAEVLYLLGEYYSRDEYIKMSSNMLGRVAPEITKNGPYYANWASLLGIMVTGPYEVAVMGSDALRMTNKIRQQYHPTVLFMGGVKENLPLLENKNVDGRTIIYVCRNKLCKLPVEDVQRAIDQLK